MSMVTVGNTGNAADNGCSAVSYSYQIGAYEVTGSQYTTFLNAVGSTDTYAIYNANIKVSDIPSKTSCLGCRLLLVDTGGMVGMPERS